MSVYWKDLSKSFNTYVNAHPIEGQIEGLYAPMNYILDLGGKRVRPVLCLMANSLFQGNQEEAMHAAIAIEYFHNFTLIHDDIMDEAPIRRGQMTVHEKWNRDTAILSGDALFVKVYQELEKLSDVHYKSVHKVFNQTALEVCEGQQMDMDFESCAPEEVAIESYIEMIRLKTAVLLGCSLKIGAILADANEKDIEEIYQFGINMGIAFQIQDDYLDAFAENTSFGKQVGGDIKANKKTFLLLSAFEKAGDVELQQLNQLLTQKNKQDEKVDQMLKLFDALGVKEDTKSRMNDYHRLAMQALARISVSDERKKPLMELAKSLLVRAT